VGEKGRVHYVCDAAISKGNASKGRLKRYACG
jgi:hypothetical protein